MAAIISTLGCKGQKRAILEKPGPFTLILKNKLDLSKSQDGVLFISSLSLPMSLSLSLSFSPSVLSSLPPLSEALKLRGSFLNLFSQ